MVLKVPMLEHIGMWEIVHHPIASCRYFILRCRLRRALFLGIVPELVCKIEALLEELDDAPLPVRNFATNHELAVFPHVVDRVQLFQCQPTSQQRGQLSFTFML